MRKINVKLAVLRRGKALFPSSDAKMNLVLVESRTLGVVMLRYRRPR